MDNWLSYHYCRDHLGSVREVLTGEGTLVARYDYSPYGERIMRYQDASYGPCEFGFTGHLTLQSPVTGQGDLVLAFYRAYDPALGCWLSEDPLGLEGGINLYAYVAGHPLGLTDPFGLTWDEDLVNALPGWATNALAKSPDIPKPVLNFGAGFGDSWTFNLTRKLRGGHGSKSHR